MTEFSVYGLVSNSGDPSRAGGDFLFTEVNESVIYTEGLALFAAQ